LDRSYQLSLAALAEGQQSKRPEAAEQVSQFQLADNYVDLLAAERLAQDVACNFEHPMFAEKLALARYFTSGQAERCAARARHLVELFTPTLGPAARWMAERAHQLSVFNAAREQEVRRASSGLSAGMSLE
ncbi:MAG: hypothetical protein KGJ86_18015, partial [Chloroflexota bacterium]|nr:hypothetical protein [Chloroflexota bacterium]